MKKLSNHLKVSHLEISERLFFGSIIAFLAFAVLLNILEGNNPHLHYKSFIDFFFDSVSVGTLTGLFRGDSGIFSFSGQFVLLVHVLLNH